MTNSLKVFHVGQPS